MIVLMSMVLLQESYYVDGTKLTLVDGTRIMTLSDVQTDLYNYFWYEDGVYVTFPKSAIAEVEYFSFRELGRKPKLKSQNIHQRRISGLPAYYDAKGSHYLRVLHVDQRGRNIEGMLRKNRVTSLQVQKQDNEYYYSFELDMADPPSLLEFHIYNMNGKRMATAMVDLEMFPRTKKEVKKGELTGFFLLPSSFDPRTFGLVEVLSFSKKVVQ